MKYACTSKTYFRATPYVLEIEEIAKHALLATLVRILSMIRITRRFLIVLALRLLKRGAPLDNLVELSTIQPYAAAGGAIINLDTLTIRHL